MNINVLKRKCNGCGECAMVCPIGCMIIHEEEHVAECITPEYCLLCGSCQDVCKERAIIML